MVAGGITPPQTTSTSRGAGGVERLDELGHRVLCPAAGSRRRSHARRSRSPGAPPPRASGTAVRYRRRSRYRRRRGDHLGAAVMAVLPQLHHQQAGPAAAFLGEAGDILLDAPELGIAGRSTAIDAGDGAGRGLVAGEDALQAPRRLPPPSPAPAWPRWSGREDWPQRRPSRRGRRPAARSAPPRPWRDRARTDLRQPGDLGRPHLAVVDVEDLDLVLLGRADIC